jgi:hypothetical protein
MINFTFFTFFYIFHISKHFHAPFHVLSGLYMKMSTLSGRLADMSDGQSH